MSNLKSLLFYLALACLLTPFLFQTATYFPFITLKTTVFRFIVEIMLIVWLIRLSLSQQPTCQLTPLIKNVLIYGLVIFISALLGANFWWSFFSSNERMEGIFGVWHFILFFLILATTFDWSELKNLLKYQVYISLAYSVVAILAYAGHRLDLKLNTSPLFILSGMGLSLLISGILIYRMIKKIEEK